MSEVQVINKGDIWQYVPGKTETTYANNNIFHTLAGTPAITALKLVINGDEVESLDYFKVGTSLELEISVPVVPTAGDVRAWGFKIDNDGNKGRMEFDITDTVFSAKVYDADGTIIASKTIPWDSDWTATEAKYRITWGERYVCFSVNGTIVANFQDQSDFTTQTLSKKPMPIHIQNDNADALNVALISIY
jgi:hypothetical protein